MRVATVGIFTLLEIALALADGRESLETKRLIAGARQCDEVAIAKYSMVKDETADAVAVAAFDSCKDAWLSASGQFLADTKPRYDDHYAKTNPWYITEYFRALSELPSEGEIFESWRDGETRRLKVLVLDMKSKKQ